MRKLSALSFAALLFGQLATSWADPPAGRGNGNGATRSTLQRAVDSRAGLQQRANVRAQGSANAGAGVGAGQNSANANGNAGVNASAQADGGGAANAQGGTGRLPREVVVRRLQLLRNQQSAVVRQASRTELGIGNGSSSNTSGTSDKKPQPNNKPPRGKSGQGPNPDSPSDDSADSRNPSGLLKLNGSARSEVVAHGQNRLALTNADKILAQRLAQIDLMRDQAVESDNDQLLDQADRLELRARTQYAERLAAGADDPATQAGANAQGQATGAIRGRANRTTPRNPNPGAPTDGSSNPTTATDDDLLTGEAAAATQNEATASLRNRAQRAQSGRRPATPPAEPGKIRNASLSGQANSANAADAAASSAGENNSLDAAGTSATNAAANAQNK